jgi:hypothetical protein
MTASWVGEDLEEGERQIAPFREKVPPALDLLGQFPYTFLQAASDPLAPRGRRTTATMSGFLDDLTDEIMDAAIAQAERFPSPFSFIEFTQMGGEVARVPADETAASAFRDAGFLYITGANCIDEADVAACREWTFEADAALQAFRRPGRYINFLSEDDDDDIREAFGERTFGRLAEVKAKYDPDDVFSYNPSRRSAAIPQTA